jgi:hypothetical protein
MQRSKEEEAEVIVRLDFMDQVAHICVCQWPAMAAKMRKRYGPSRDPGSQFSERWKVPLKTISFRSLSKMSEKTRKPSIKTNVLASGSARRSTFATSTGATQPEVQ